MKILLVDNHTKNLKEFKNLLKDYDFSICTKESFSREMANKFELIIFSGGTNVRSVKNHPEDYKKEIDFIKETDKKVIGVCLGCEIIAKAFNCELKELVVGKKGITNIKFDKKEISIYESHRFIIDKLSSEIEVLATSEHGIEAIKHKTKLIYGLQFHPEMFVDKTEGKEIFLNILETI